MRRSTFEFRIATELSLRVIPGFNDNYFYVLHHQPDLRAAFVDPGDAKELISAVDSLGLHPEFIFLTHHHQDHSGGVEQLLTRWPSLQIICSPWFRVPSHWNISKLIRLQPGESFALWNHFIQALDVRGHTLDHIAFILRDSIGAEVTDLFVGDALFGAGCGGLFEGTHVQMLDALKAIRALPESTRVWCAHEYTIKNLRVAAQLNENNPAQQARLQALEEVLQKENLEPHQWITLPLSLKEEKDTNPFLRWDTLSLQKAIDTTDDLATFTFVRTFRDRF